MTDELEIVKARFRTRCARDLVALDSVGTGEWQADCQTIVHRLAGISSTLGFQRLGLLSAEIDSQLIAGRQPRPRQVEELCKVLRKAAGT